MTGNENVRRYVCFRSSFAYPAAPNISHVTTLDGTKTMCGRTGWETFGDKYDPAIGVDCLHCAKAMKRIERAK